MKDWRHSEEILDQGKTEARQLHATPCLVSKGLDDLVLQVLLAITRFSLLVHFCSPCTGLLSRYRKALASPTPWELGCHPGFISTTSHNDRSGSLSMPEIPHPLPGLKSCWNHGGRFHYPFAPSARMLLPGSAASSGWTLFTWTTFAEAFVWCSFLGADHFLG